MPHKELEIQNKLGLHARAAAKLVQTASAFEAEVNLHHNGKDVSGKSIMGVMMLAAGKGARIGVSTDGSDEHAALEAIENLINDLFGEGE